MVRLARLVALGAAPLAIAVVALLGTLAVPVGADAAATARPNVVSPPPSPTPPTCFGCVAPQDAVCWEDTRCPEPVRVVATTHLITVHYKTVAMTAHPQIDYVPVTDAILTIPAGQTTAYVYIQLLPDPGMIQDKQFAIEFYNIVGGQLTRSQAIVTITPPGAPN